MALHWAISQFHGNSEIGPGNTLERIFAVSMQVVGLLVLSIFVSAVTNIILQERRCHKRFYERMENMRTYFLHHKVSSQLMLGVKTYLKNATDEEWVDDIEVLEGLPDSLQKRVLFEARMPTVESHCLFVWLKHQHGAAFRTICHSAIYSMRYMAATVVFEAGDVWDKLIFLEDGHLRYVADQFDPSGGIRRPSAVFRQISRRYVGIRIAKNSGLCELALWVQSWQSKGDLVAVSSSSLLCLDSSALAQDLCSFPDARRDVVMYVHGLVQEISDMEPGMLNDLWKQA